MDTSTNKILSDLRAKKYAPVYILQGEEPYYIDLISKTIESNVLAESEKLFNQIILYGKETTVATILNHARRFPMMAERQVIIVREAQDIQDLTKAQAQRLILNYLQQPTPSTILVLCYKHKTLDKRTELGKKADQLALTVTFKKLFENQLPEFIKAYLHDRGYSLDEQSVDILCQAIGNDLIRMAHEIDKLIGSMKENEHHMVAGYVMDKVGINRNYNVFELQQALLSRNTLKTHQIVSYFIDNQKKNPPISLVAFLFSFFSKLLVASVATTKTEKEFIQLLKISPFVAKTYLRSLQYFSPTKILKNIALLKTADLKLKGVNNGSEESEQVIKELFIHLLR